MVMTVEMARFVVKPGAEAAMLSERPAMLEAARKHFPAHRDAYLCKLDDGTWIDIVLWSDRQQAEEAAEGFYRYPEINTWFRHVERMIGFEYADVEQISYPENPDREAQR
ncbi:hypothetical protein [Rhodoligotrophos defluvii]|uniref:hypothetical protein n=1 Tax=Rhodoligotrophos defluvii TaxID=2561934 RepID=UPI0010C950AC|nr:hypothetical protein [Rhodoligotrophos defluvii]